MTSNWINHTFSRRRFETRNRAVTLAILGIAIMLVLGSVYLSQVASFAITNRAIEDLIAERDELRNVNDQLIAEIARYRTVPRLTARALEIGFLPATNADIDYVVIEGYQPASNRDLFVASSATLQIDQPPEYEETFGGWLQRQLTQWRTQLETFGS